MAINHHLTVSAELPYVRRDDLREGEHSHSGGQAVNEVVQLGSVSGIGDMNLLAKYRLTEGEGAGFALIGGIKLPTGSTHRRSLDGERLETEHQPGTGSWDPIVGASASAPLGAVRLTASALYQVSGKGAQARGSATVYRAGSRCRTASARRRTRITTRTTIIMATSSTSITKRRIRVMGCVRRAGRRMGGPAEGRRRDRASERRQMGLCRARRSVQRGVGLDARRPRSRCRCGSTFARRIPTIAIG